MAPLGTMLPAELGASLLLLTSSQLRARLPQAEYSCRPEALERSLL